MHVELSFELGALDPQRAEAACFACGAAAVTFADAGDDPVLEPLPGELRLWPATRLSALFVDAGEARALCATLAAAVGLDPGLIDARALPERVWERVWLEGFHALRFGERLWVCPRHERVAAAGAVVVTLDPGLAFGTGTHPSTALCLGWLDGHLEHGARVIDYGCGSGVLALASARLGAAEVHCFDIDPQALIATRANAAANGVADIVRIHASEAALPRGVDVLLANILSGPLCALADAFAARVRRAGQVVLAGLMQHEVADVTGAYAACFDIVRYGEREDWVCLCGRRR
ncbi:MAG TPA: 50S ribosomal protein L11 methyltransferase [Steroidobacteraceae bacterium]|nr:50S ribosomal protein L11 methyltransferase [Steroidobacteraceae bacterium]